MTPKEKPFIQTIDQPASTPTSAQKSSRHLFKPKKINKLLLVLFTLLFVLILLFLLSIFSKSPKEEDVKKTIPTITITPPQTSPSPFNDQNQQIENIRKIILDKSLLPLPDIDLNISL